MRNAEQTNKWAGGVGGDKFKISKYLDKNKYDRAVAELKLSHGYTGFIRVSVAIISK
jgi:hypothetical protein